MHESIARLADCQVDMSAGSDSDGREGRSGWKGDGEGESQLKLEKPVPRAALIGLRSAEVGEARPESSSQPTDHLRRC